MIFIINPNSTVPILKCKQHAPKRNQTNKQETSHLMRKPIMCICKNKDADQLCSNCEADQCLCFCYTDSTILLLAKSKISSV